MRLVRASSRGSSAVSRSCDVIAGPDQHHNLLQRTIAGSLADSVDRALDLAGPGQQAGIGVGDGQAEVVVAVDRGLDLTEAGNQLVETPEVAGVLLAAWHSRPYRGC